MRLRDLKDRLKGTEKRLATAEALLSHAGASLQCEYEWKTEVCSCTWHGDPITPELVRKIQQFLSEPLDTDSE